MSAESGARGTSQVRRSRTVATPQLPDVEVRGTILHGRELTLRVLMTNHPGQTKIDRPVSRHMTALVDAIVLIFSEATLAVARNYCVVLTLNYLSWRLRHHARADAHVHPVEIICHV